MNHKNESYNMTKAMGVPILHGDSQVIANLGQ